MKALVVDDSRAIRIFIGRILRELGFTVVEAGNGREALDILGTSGPVEVALVDWNMPVMDGFEFIQSCRADSDLTEMPILMITTETETEQVERALAAGANEYLMKPFAREHLAHKLCLLGFEAS